MTWRPETTGSTHITWITTRDVHTVPHFYKFQQHFSYHLSWHHWLVLLQLAGLLLGKPPCQQKWGEKVTGAWQSIRGKVAIKLKRYLIRTIKQATATTHMKVTTWEKFEKGVGAFLLNKYWRDINPFSTRILLLLHETLITATTGSFCQFSHHCSMYWS